MIINVKVRPGNAPPISQDGFIVISTKEEFQKGMANRDVIRQIAEFYGVRLSSVKIRVGFTSRRKTVEIIDEDTD